MALVTRLDTSAETGYGWNRRINYGNFPAGLLSQVFDVLGSRQAPSLWLDTRQTMLVHGPQTSSPGGDLEALQSLPKELILASRLRVKGLGFA